MAGAARRTAGDRAHRSAVGPHPTRARSSTGSTMRSIRRSRPTASRLSVSGNAGGLIDLYRLTLDTGALERLTNDPFADLEPAFTPDGRTVVFVTERYSTTSRRSSRARCGSRGSISATRAVRPIAGFLRGKHLSPQVSADGALGDVHRRPGRRQQPLSHADRRRSDRAAVVGADRRRRHHVDQPGAQRVGNRAARRSACSRTTATPSTCSIRPTSVALVPPPATERRRCCRAGRRRPVTCSVSSPTRHADCRRPVSQAAVRAVQRRAHARRDRAADDSGRCIEFGGRTVQGGISAFFSDMLGDRALGVRRADRRHARPTSAAELRLRQPPAPLELGDFGRRLAVRRSATSAAPTRLTRSRCARSSSGRSCECAIGRGDASVQHLDAARGRGVARRCCRSCATRTAVFDHGDARADDVTSSGPRPRATRCISASAARARARHVVFGATAPLYGARSRFEMGFSTGSLQYRTLLLDWRRYYMPVAPVTIAVRGLHYGRYGATAISNGSSISTSAIPSSCTATASGRSRRPSARGSGRAECAVFDRLIGSRMAVVNIEVRAPLAASSRVSSSTAAFRSTSRRSSTRASPGPRTTHPRSPAAHAASSAASALPCASTSSALIRRGRRRASARSRRPRPAVADGIRQGF